MKGELYLDGKEVINVDSIITKYSITGLTGSTISGFTTITSEGGLWGGGTFTPVVGAFSNFGGGVTQASNVLGGVQYRNESGGGTAEMRFVVASDTDDYMAFTHGSTANVGTLFGLAKNTTDFIFNNGSSDRNLLLGTFAGGDVIFGTNNDEKIRIDNATGNLLLVDGQSISMGSDLTGWAFTQDSTNLSLLYDSAEKVYFDINGGIILDGNATGSIVRFNAIHYHRTSQEAYGGQQQGVDDGVKQWYGFTGGGNNHWIRTTYANKGSDHDHDTMSDVPVDFWHDDTAPDTDNTQWGSVRYEDGNFNLNTGSGAINLETGLSRPITTVSGATYTVSFGTDAYLSITRTATGACTVTLPDITAAMDGYELPFKEAGYNASANTLTIAADGTDTIENLASLAFTSDGDNGTLKANASTNNWELID
jgi:hypothetical protein